ARHDESPFVRLAALRVRAPSRPPLGTCDAYLEAATDDNAHVALLAIDQLRLCDGAPDAVAFLQRTVDDLSHAGSARGWHRSAHAIVALASAAPDTAKAALPQFTGS